MGNRITNVEKDENGVIIKYSINGGKMIGKEKAIKMAENGEIDDVVVVENKKGKKHLRSRPNGDEKDNLGNR